MLGYLGTYHKEHCDFQKFTYFRVVTLTRTPQCLNSVLGHDVTEIKAI